MKNFKLGVGPMSHEINECIDLYAENEPLLVVASRNQVDYINGYVCKTDKLPSYFSMRSNILLCRDHCGPYFKDTDKSLTLKEAIGECKKTIEADIKAGFDLIHIDVSRIEQNFQLDSARELFEYALNLNPYILFEFGSEDNTGIGLTESLQRIDDHLEFISTYKPNIVYFVSQTGSLTKHKQVGTFDIEFNRRQIEKVHNAGLLFKEHNADYLDRPEVILRQTAGVDAMNIAPQLGTVQTSILKTLSKNNQEWNNFANLVYSKELWKKWMPDNIGDKELAVIVSGHYFFNTTEYKYLKDSIDEYKFFSELKKSIHSIFECYTKV